MISLPDVNVLLALVAAGHTHHASAHGWFETQEPDSVGICRVTQMGLLRLLTNPKVLPSGVHPIDRAWDIANEVLADKRAFFEYEPPELEAAWMGMMRHKTVGPYSWTDAYLAAFAKQCDYEMVTFDRGFSRWSGLTLKVLASGPGIATPRRTTRVTRTLRRYAWLIIKGAPYRTAWRQYLKEHDPHSPIASVAHSYATDPNYAGLAESIAVQTNVAGAIATARKEGSARATA